MKQKLIIFLIFVIAFLLRIYGINWDQGQHLHPDERFLTMVAADIKIPSSINQYLSTTTSPLNPYNNPNYQFFVYGTFPLFLTKFIAHLFNQDSYASVYLWGRGLSALFDSLIVILLYFLSKKRFLPSLLYTFAVLPLQLSHFFAVDTFLNFFILATFTLLTYNLYLLAAVVFGFALACKISAIYFIPIILLFLIKKPKKALYFALTFLVFRVFQPYAFVGLFDINPLFISNLKTLTSFSNPTAWFPPAVQWLSKTPLLFPLQNLVFWGVGLPLTILLLLTNFKAKISLALVWIIFLFLIQGSQFASTMRYFLPIYPFICLLVTKHYKLLIATHIVFGLLFLSIYSRPHTRVQASDWIYQNIPIGSNISYEYWDDPLPLNSQNYNGYKLPLYDPDTPEKWQMINAQMKNINYLIMSSNRLWGSIPLVPNKYPISTKFYQDLFSEQLKFKKVIEINSYPGFHLPFLHNCYYFGPTNFPGIKNNWFTRDICSYPGIYFRDDTAEEAFTVYDHPKVLIFKRQ